MKLKRLLAGILTGAMMITGVPALGLDMAASIPVYAEDAEAKEESIYPDVVEGLDDIKASSVDSASANAVAGNIAKKDDSTWISEDVTSYTPQWIQIDLGESKTTVDRIEVVYGDAVWDMNYTISTYATENNTTRKTVKTVGASGPSTAEGELEPENRDDETKTDLILRNNGNQKIILDRYVRFTFSHTSNTSVTGKKVSLKQIRIYGTDSKQIYGPTIEVSKPVAGEYPKIADVKAADDGKATYHTTIADRTTPGATFIKRGSGTETWGTRTLLDGTTEVKVPVVTGGTAPELTVDPNQDGVFGFSTDAQTIGTSNKFDVFGNDVKIVSVQLYLNKAPSRTIDILGKGDKFALQMNADRIYTYMNGQGRNKWNEENFWFANHGGVTAFVGKWLDILVVVDGAGKQRIYVDGVPGVSKEKSAAIPEEHPQDKGLQPFTIGSNLANYSKNGNYWDTTLPHDVSASAFTKEDGYIARLKFYSNKNYAGMENGAGTDISDAQTLSAAFNNGTVEGETANFTIEKLETQAGVTQDSLPAGATASAKESDESIAKRSKVYYMITNMLQKEQPTARISLCPYSRSTVWQEYKDNAWTDIPATEAFPEDLTGKKFRAVTTLYADDGFIFHDESRDVVRENLNANDENAVTTVNITSGSKNREMEIMVYYGCTGVNDAAVEDGICRLEDLILVNDTVHVEKTNDENQTVNIGEAHAHIEQLCKRHQDAAVEITYSTTDSEYLEIADEKSPVVKVKKSNKAILGYNQARVTVTATLKDAAGNTISTTGTNPTPVTMTKTVDIEIDNPKEADQVIEVAPVITAQAPVIGEFPQVVDVALPDGAKHFNDVADRMEPNATLEPLTKDYIQNSNYLKTFQDNQVKNGRPKRPDNDWIAQWETDADGKYAPVIDNVDGIIGFNVVGQTPGDTNKFDVFGRDIKLVSFKLYLKKWPDNPYKVTADDGATLDIYGKSNKYAMQVTSQKKLIMYMRNEQNGWPQETYQADDEFLNKWHNIFMVVDGKGWQRLYVDGKRSTTIGGGRPGQGSAFAKEFDDADYRKPFTLGYNSESNHPSWYDDIFTNDYGYIADFEFYSNKNYDNVVNGAGTDISEAQVLTPEQAKIIDLEKLERDYANNLDAIGTILTNLLQERNATACITASPYVAKTNWSQKTGEKDGEDVYENLDKINAEAFTFSSNYRSVTTLTAYDGFVFKSDEAFTKAVAANFHTAGGEQAASVEVTVGPNAKNEANKVLTITATYGKTAEAPCTCEMAITPPAPVEIEIAAGQATGTGTLESTDETDIALTCLKGDHISEKKYSLEYGIKAGDEDKIDFDLDTKKVTAKKAGTAHITLTATLQTKNDSGAWVDYTNEDPNGAKKVTKTIEIAVNVTRADAASAAEKTGLTTEINNAKKEYPDSVADDYEADAWQELQDALAEAAELAKANNLDATTSQITASKAKIAAAIEALAGKKSEKGKAKDALKSVLEDAVLKALIDGNNADKKYTADSFKKLTEAYAEAESKLATADAAALGTLKTNLETAWKGLKEVTTGGTGTGTGVKDGEVLKGADGTQYQDASAKDKTVIITKGVDAKTIKVGPTVVINKETYKVIGIGSKAYTGLKKATKVIINANVASIGDQAFAKSKKLKNVTFGADVAKIGKKAFFNCPKLNKVILKGTALNNKSFGKQAFQKTAKKVTVKWGKVKGKQRTQLKKALKKAKLKVK